MKKLLLALGLLALLVGGVFAALYFLKIGPFAEVATEEGAAALSDEEATAAATAKGGGGGFLSANTPVFYELDPLIVPIFDDNKVVATIQVHIKLEVVGNENREQVSKLRPRISDVLLRDLYGFLPRLIQSRNHVDVAILKQRMKLIVDRTIGKGIVKDVLIQSISDQAN